jgi:hypothetical protein
MNAQFRVLDGEVVLVISELDLQKLMNDQSQRVSVSDIFSDPFYIATLIRRGEKIQAIKEMRVQTEWGLLEAKNYIDKYLRPMEYSDMRNTNLLPEDFARQRQKRNELAAEDFLKDHTMRIADI